MCFPRLKKMGRLHSRKCSTAAGDRICRIRSPEKSAVAQVTVRD
jgi:hypothetical protein